MRIRMLVAVGGQLAPGITAPAVGECVEVDQATADSWCDGVRAEAAPAVTSKRVYIDVDAAIEQVHADARVYHDAVVEQLQERIRLLEAALAAGDAPGISTLSAAEPAAGQGKRPRR